MASNTSTPAAAATTMTTPSKAPGFAVWKGTSPEYELLQGGTGTIRFPYLKHAGHARPENFWVYRGTGARKDCIYYVFYEEASVTDDGVKLPETPYVSSRKLLQILCSSKKYPEISAKFQEFVKRFGEPSLAPRVTSADDAWSSSTTSSSSPPVAVAQSSAQQHPPTSSEIQRECEKKLTNATDDGTTKKEVPAPTEQRREGKQQPKEAVPTARGGNCALLRQYEPPRGCPLPPCSSVEVERDDQKILKRAADSRTMYLYATDAEEIRKRFERRVPEVMRGATSTRKRVFVEPLAQNDVE